MHFYYFEKLNKNLKNFVIQFHLLRARFGILVQYYQVN
jgi:hypothetical protein